MNAIQPIVPIQSIDAIGQLGSVSKAAESGGVSLPFQSMFQDAVSSVKETSASLDGEIAKLATGNADNMHDALIASEKANLSVDMVVELRNKLLDAYKEISNINI